MNKALIISKYRKLARKNDTKELQAKRIKWLNKVLVNYYDFQTLEMYPFNNEDGVVKSKSEFPQYLHEVKFHNTQPKTIHTTVLEIDKLPLDKAIDVICKTCLSLIKTEIHFVVFFAEGGRSPYIFIFDWKQLEEVNEFHRIRLQIKFWRRHVPMEYFGYIDTALFHDNHYHPIPFSIHWRHFTPFDLLFEFLPEVKECNN